jgi:cytochrome c550
MLLVGQQGRSINVAAAPTRQDSDHGRELFLNNGCTACHGEQAQGQLGPRLAGTRLDFDQVLGQLREPTGGMPAFDEALISDEEAFDVYAYLRELGGLSVPESPFGDMSDENMDDGAMDEESDDEEEMAPVP